MALAAARGLNEGPLQNGEQANVFYLEAKDHVEGHGFQAGGLLGVTRTG